MIFLSQQSAAGGIGPGPALSLLLLIAAVLGWLGLRALMRRLRADKAEAVVGGAFTAFALEALVNAARLDGKISPGERGAVLAAMRQIAGDALSQDAVEAAFAQARLSKDELIDYLRERGEAFSRAEKLEFLKALLAVLAADGRFDEQEHHALVDYTAAIGFDREGAPGLLRGLMGDLVRDRIT